MRFLKGRAALWGAAVVFLIFLLNVMLGSAGTPMFLGDVGEAVTLVIAVILFVIGILRAEAAARQRNH